MLDDRRIAAIRSAADHDGLDAHLAFLADSVDEAQRARLTAA